jgi:hypothetical protein
MVLGWDPETIPNWGDNTQFGDDWLERRIEWYRDRGIGIVELPVWGAKWDMRQWSEWLGKYSSGPVIFGGASDHGTNHVVVMFGGKIYDPMKAGGPLKPHDTGYYWITTLVRLP